MQVSKEEGIELAKEFNCPFFETSAALRLNVDEIFHEIVRCIQKKESADHMSKTQPSHNKKVQSSKSTGGKSTGSKSTEGLCCVKSPTNP